MDFRQNYQNFSKRTTSDKTKNNSTGRKTNRTTYESDPYDFASDASNYQFTNEDPFYDYQEFHDVYDQYEDPFSIFEQYNLDPNYVAEDFYQNYSHLFNSYQEFEQYLHDFNREEKVKKGKKKNKKRKMKTKTKKTSNKENTDENYFNFP